MAYRRTYPRTNVRPLGICRISNIGTLIAEKGYRVHVRLLRVLVLMP